MSEEHFDRLLDLFDAMKGHRDALLNEVKSLRELLSEIAILTKSPDDPWLAVARVYSAATMALRDPQTTPSGPNSTPRD